MTKTRAKYYDKLKQDNPELYWSTDVQRRMANDKKRMGRSFEEQFEFNFSKRHLNVSLGTRRSDMSVVISNNITSASSVSPLLNASNTSKTAKIWAGVVKV